MANSKELFNDLRSKIELDEPADEIKSILFLILEHEFALTRTDIMTGREIEPVDRSTVYEILKRINRHEPVQYILGEADFFGRKFLVTPDVLIPRPETEMIVDEVLRHSPSSGKIIDLGTGSGCLAVSLAKTLPGMRILATDISDKALFVAEANAKKHQALVEFLQHDMLTEYLPSENITIIVSNPPYIPPSEKLQMKKNVLAYEPARALFVPEGDPLLFYKAIASIAENILAPTGRVVVEINEKFGAEVVSVFKEHGFKRVSISRDLNGKDRIVTASF
jgi:release factor glutamine methyltransferase